MSEPDDLNRLRDLDARIARARKAQEPEPPRNDGHMLAQQGWRMVTEMVAGLLVGFGIGWGLDLLFGTRPLFLVLFVLLGLVAGIRMMLRTAAEIQRQQQGPGRPGERGDADRG
jgi:ATP synthase protein I